MDKQTKYFLARLLGETYRAQMLSAPDKCPVGPATIYGLSNGFEHVVEKHFEDALSGPTRKEYHDMHSVLDAIREQGQKPDGIYQIELEAKQQGIRSDNIRPILKMLYAEDKYQDLIKGLRIRLDLD